ncbi:MAG: hypothetical protein J7K10_02610 [Thermodesulfobacterium sp.]|nr:hypothetical protein [Thermodesulfobacterium sp.]
MEVIKGKKTLSEIVSEYGIYLNKQKDGLINSLLLPIKSLKSLITLQKKQLKKGLDKAYKKIDKVELDFLRGCLEKI